MIDAQRIGAVIALLRKQHKMTQTQLASELKVTHQAVSKWERGLSLPDLELLASMSKLFQVRVDDLLGLTGASEDEKGAVPPEQTETNHFPAPVEVAEHMASVDIDQIWEGARDIIKRQISKPSYDTWIRNLRALFENGSIVIVSANRFQNEWLKTRYSKMIRIALEQVTEMNEVKLDFNIRPELLRR
ncbi:helix-turn-helix domain-containing protein [Paenibacillus sp. GCM10012303]|jgi:transcriptional regulator with XRE-family HTH domain|uniref:helix-turn-helix domain-containing protein n=1 Tax=Paenibacillus sp. GCM10012303 TaxID=3317340 RepID=UPI003622CF32